MVDRRGDSNTTKVCDQFSRLLNRFSAVVLGAARACRAASADDGRASFAQGRRDASPCAARRPGHHGRPTTQRLGV